MSNVKVEAAAQWAERIDELEARINALASEKARLERELFKERAAHQKTKEALSLYGVGGGDLILIP